MLIVLCYVLTCGNTSLTNILRNIEKLKHSQEHSLYSYWKKVQLVVAEGAYSAQKKRNVACSARLLGVFLVWIFLLEGLNFIKMKYSFVTSVGQGKNLSPWRYLNPWHPRYRLGAVTTELRETLGEVPTVYRPFTRFTCDPCLAYC